MSTQDLVIIKPSISAIAPSSEGGCLSSAMLRAKIDLRQPSFLLRPRTVTATVSSQGLKNTQFPRFGAEIILHIIGMRTPVTQRSADTAFSAPALPRACRVSYIAVTCTCGRGAFRSALIGARLRSHEHAA